LSRLPSITQAVPARKKGLCKNAQGPLNIDEKNDLAAMQHKIGPFRGVAPLHKDRVQHT
jgi:hypothetical protein